MFTRYVTFIFLVGLSALFFTSGRSAPIGGESRKNPLSGATTAKQEAAPESAGMMPGPAEAETVDLDKIDGASFGGYDHNGSVMWTALTDGLIVYAEPKASIRDVVKPGSVLFRGKPFMQGARLHGTAYAFKKGCAPAPYAVRGGYSRDNATITLRGAGPIRQGCEVVGYSEKSPHAVLKFTSMMSP
jgi:hypothetical protein